VALTVDDMLLVLLSSHPCSAYELQRQHALIFGQSRAVDIIRVLAAVNRLERSGYLRIDTAAARRDHTNRPLCVVTDAGRRRQEAWLLDVTATAEPEDVYVRGMLAVEAADPATFDAFVSRSLSITRRRQQELATAAAGRPLVGRAGVAFEHEMIRALVQWLHQLPDHRAPVTTGGVGSPSP